ncbi:MAG: SGNH/GDSL hydrolase family protein [Bryobacteraceae bacterium]
MRVPTILLALASLTVCSAQFRVLSGQRILLHGDSITKGYGFGNYKDPSPLRTLHGISTLLFRDNLAHPPAMPVLTYDWNLGPDRKPMTIDTVAAQVKSQVQRGEIRPGDWLIYEDAGGIDDFMHPAPWPNPQNMYARYRKSLRDMVHEAENTVGRDHILLMTMFDYNPGKRCTWCKWDAPLDDGKRTGNDAIRDEAVALGVQYIDMNRIMDAANEHVVARGFGRMVGPDGVHPNVYGNYVMVLAMTDALGADIAKWKLDGLAKHFLHPETGGDVPTVWGFTKDPTDAERRELLEELRTIVVRLPKVALPAPHANTTAHTFRRLIRHGRILDHPAVQPEHTTKVATYELGKLLQLDRSHALLMASLREQGGHDFCIGNDAIVFRDLSEIRPERAIPLNRLDPNYRLKSGAGTGVQGKFPATGAFVPLGAKLDDGSPHPAAGTGFALSATATFSGDRSEMLKDGDRWIEFLQLRWDGSKLGVQGDPLPDSLFGVHLINQGFQCVPQDTGMLCPLVSDKGIVVIRFESSGGRWKPAIAGTPFFTHPSEWEPSLRVHDGEYRLYTRSRDGRGRMYRSSDGLNYRFLFDQKTHTVPQVLNQGLDDSLYVATNLGPGMLRNPLLAFAVNGHSLVDQIAVHDEKRIHEDFSRTDKSKEVPFADHGVADNVFLNGRWRHLLLYRLIDLRETNGEGAPPTPQSGLYLAEFEYAKTVLRPFGF